MHSYVLDLLMKRDDNAAFSVMVAVLSDPKVIKLSV